jgi:hypothetical protein
MFISSKLKFGPAFAQLQKKYWEVFIPYSFVPFSEGKQGKLFWV